MKSLTANKALITIGLTVAILMAWMVFLYQPTRQKLETTRVQIASLDQEVNAAKQFLTTTAQALEHNAWPRQKHDLLANLYRFDSLEILVDRMAGDFRGFGVSNVEFAPDLNELLKVTRIPLGTAMLVKGRFEARLQGRFISIGKALEYLEQQSYFMDLYSMDITYNDATNPEVLCTMNFAVYLREQEATHD